MKGRIRFMTTITPAYADAYQAAILGLPKLKARYPFLPNARSATGERGNDFRGWTIYTDGCTRVVDGETVAGWVCDCTISPWKN